jgi:hypothetical protein
MSGGVVGESAGHFNALIDFWRKFDTGAVLSLRYSITDNHTPI